MSIDPVSGSMNPFTIWDTDILTITGAVSVEASRRDITLCFQTFMKGLETVPDGVAQTEEHRLKIVKANLWWYPLGE